MRKWVNFIEQHGIAWSAARCAAPLPIHGQELQVGAATADLMPRKQPASSAAAAPAHCRQDLLITLTSTE